MASFVMAPFVTLLDISQARSRNIKLRNMKRGYCSTCDTVYLGIDMHYCDTCGRKITVGYNESIYDFLMEAFTNHKKYVLQKVLYESVTSKVKNAVDEKTPIYRIISCKSFGVEKRIGFGEVGGYVSGEDNLSHDGNSWICRKAAAIQNANVSGNALLSMNTIISGNASIDGNVVTGIDTTISGNAFYLCNNDGERCKLSHTMLSDYAYINGVNMNCCEIGGHVSIDIKDGRVLPKIELLQNVKLGKNERIFGIEAIRSLKNAHVEI